MKLKQFFEELQKLNEDENSDMNKTQPPGNMGDYVNTAQAAVELGVSMGRIRQLVREKQLKSIPPEKGKRDHTFAMSDIREFDKKPRERTGRPKGT